jgi:hypothetical protein
MARLEILHDLALKVLEKLVIASILYLLAQIIGLRLN